ncbi:MAG: hypothetical protein V7603_5688 [Micromonosporaceae bacterium]
MDPERVNWARYDPGRRTGHYESFYLRANHPTRPLACWLRYTVFSPEGRPEAAVGELWAVVFDGETGRHVVGRTEVPMVACGFAADAFAVRVGEASLGPDALRGAAGPVSWDLRYGGGRPPLFLLPRRLYRGGFPKAKSLVGAPLARFEGVLRAGERDIDVDGWLGSQNHNWGSRHTDRYAFGQVAGFDGAPDSFLEVATAGNRIGPFGTPMFTLLVLRHGGREHAFTGLRVARRATGRFGCFHWDFATGSDGVEVTGHIEAPSGAFVCLAYANPPGGTKYCLNTKIAACDLSIVDSRSGGTVALRSRHGALFEILADDPHPDVPIAA